MSDRQVGEGNWEAQVSPATRRPPFVVFFSIVGAQTRTTTDGHHVKERNNVKPAAARQAGPPDPARYQSARTPPQEARSCNYGHSFDIGLLVVFYHHPGRARVPTGARSQAPSEGV